jgi:hypothetical protein
VGQAATTRRAMGQQERAGLGEGGLTVRGPPDLGLLQVEAAKAVERMPRTARRTVTSSRLAGESTSLKGDCGASVPHRWAASAGSVPVCQ